MKDALEWYCENCNSLLYRKKFKLDNIETDMPKIFDKYYSSEENALAISVVQKWKLLKKFK